MNDRISDDDVKDAVFFTINTEVPGMFLAGNIYLFQDPKAFETLKGIARGEIDRAEFSTHDLEGGSYPTISAFSDGLGKVTMSFSGADADFPSDELLDTLEEFQVRANATQ